MSSAGPNFHFPGGPGPSSAPSSREDDRKQPLYLAHQAVRYGGGVEPKPDRDRARLAVAPPAHVQPIALTTTRAGTG